MNEAVERWLIFAEEDLKVAEIVLREGIYNQACFHAQQCAEKALKAALLTHAPDDALPRTHSVADLLRRLPPTWFADLRVALSEIMDSYYLPTRYPDALPGTLPEGLPDQGDAEEATALARKVFEQARRLAAQNSQD